MLHVIHIYNLSVYANNNKLLTVSKHYMESHAYVS